MTSNFVKCCPSCVVKLYTSQTKANLSKQLLSTCTLLSVTEYEKCNQILWYKPRDLFVGVAQTFSCLLGCLSSALFVSCQRKLGDRLPLFELKSLKITYFWIERPFTCNGCVFCLQGARAEYVVGRPDGSTKQEETAFVSSVLLIVSVSVF